MIYDSGHGLFQSASQYNFKHICFVKQDCCFLKSDSFCAPVQATMDLSKQHICEAVCTRNDQRIKTYTYTSISRLFYLLCLYRVNVSSDDSRIEFVASLLHHMMFSEEKIIA